MARTQVTLWSTYSWHGRTRAGEYIEFTFRHSKRDAIPTYWYDTLMVVALYEGGL